ncbi:hypothetical protein BT96DRAFT_150357 [Gymnopus androsaceus JB14]|uniref:Uncharacterized protein n=1 Tax=Gymnopus androsaceus JB14 TaxID=1447944 RepID=A0A6A4I9E4_9AGAR|nr:hypothetical protein BT96DRAFT_150357 [Gymnopus androsaceus JB14]
MSQSNAGLGQAPVPAGPPLIPLSGIENDDIASDSSLGSAPGIELTSTSRFSPPNLRGRKRTHSRSFPQKEKDLQLLSSVESASSSHVSSDLEKKEDAPAASKPVPTTALKSAHSIRSAGRVIEETPSEVEQDEGEIRAQEVLLTGTRKRRKVISSSSASGQGGQSTTTTSESEPVPTRTSSRRKPLSVPAAEKGTSRTTTRASRVRKQLSGTSAASASEDVDERPSSSSSNKAASTTAKGKGKTPSTKSGQTSSSVPTRKRSDVGRGLKSTGSDASLKNPSLAKSSSSTLRTTRSTAGLSSRTGATETSDIDAPSDTVASGLEADDYPLLVARERAKRRN